MDGSAALRSPFNFYRAEVNWAKPLSTSELSVGVFSNYISGKQTLPSTSLVGLILSYMIDVPTSVSPRISDVKSNSFTAWVSDPAVYMPQVLAIADAAINRCLAGSGTQFNGQFIDILAADLPFDASTQFTGNGPLTFSLSQSSGDAVINPSTGVITSTGAIDVVVTASGPCGVPASSNSFDILVPD